MRLSSILGNPESFEHMNVEEAGIQSPILSPVPLADLDIDDKHFVKMSSGNDPLGGLTALRDMLGPIKGPEIGFQQCSQPWLDPILQP